MPRHRPKGGRTTPKGTRPGHLRPVGGPGVDASPIDGFIDSGAREILDADGPIAAETWASGLLEVFESARSEARLDRQEAPPFEEMLLERCRARRDRGALVVAASLAAVLPPPLDREAGRVVDHLRRSTAAPAWTTAIGRAEPTRAFVASDVFGDQDSLMVGFAQEGEPGEHALVVLVDHNLSGQAKDAWIAADLDDVVAAWKTSGDRHMRIEEAPVGAALGRLRDAMAMSDLWNGDADLRTEEFAQHRALLWARIRRAGLAEERPDQPEFPQQEREAIVAGFMASAPGRALGPELARADAEMLARSLVDLRCDYEGRPLRWSPNVVGMLLTDLAPRKLLLDPDQAAALPSVLRAVVRFSAGRTGLDDVFVEEIVEAVDRAEQEFVDRIGDPAAAGPAKAVLAALQARGVDLTDLDAMNAALADLGPIRLPEPAPKPKRNAAAAPADVVRAAEQSPVLARFATLVAHFGDGRKLTQTGQPTLADARTLVAALGTKDRLDETIGDRTFKTRSAADLPELGFTIRWAIAAGALRKEHGKLRATAAWRKLDGQPLKRWLKAADALPTLGPLAAFHAGNRYRVGDEFLDELLPELLAVLAHRAMPFDALLDGICERAEIGYEWLTPYMQDPDHRRRSFGWDLDLLLHVLSVAGIAERVGTTAEPDRWDPRHERLVGGRVQLTPAGRWWAGSR